MTPVVAFVVSLRASSSGFPGNWLYSMQDSTPVWGNDCKTSSLYSIQASCDPTTGNTTVSGYLGDSCSGTPGIQRNVTSGSCNTYYGVGFKVTCVSGASAVQVAFTAALSAMFVVVVLLL